MERTKEHRYFIQSLAKGLAVFEALAEAQSPITLSEIAQALGTNNATATRLCYTLTKLGFLSRDKQKLYHLTPKVLALGSHSICTLGWQNIAQYYLENLFEEIQETVSLSILDGMDVLYVIRIRKERHLPFDIRIGTKLKVYYSAMGKVLMAMGNQEKTQNILKALTFDPLTNHTINSLDNFCVELDEVRKRGYAINDEELSIGNRAIAAPLVDAEDVAVAAINIAVPTIRYSRMDLEERLAPKLIKVSGEISKALIQSDMSIVLGEET